MNEHLDTSLKNALEVILFSVSEPISSYQIAKLLEEGGYAADGGSLTPGQVEKYIEILTGNWDSEGRPLTVLRIVGGYQMATRPEWVELVARLQEDRRSQRLSRAALETLAIVSYRQPVIRPDIDSIRGVNSDSALKTLLERGLVAIAGRDEGPGRPLLYRTTSNFLKYFGLNRIEDLPDPDELASILGLNVRPETGVEDGVVAGESEPAQLRLEHSFLEPLPDIDKIESEPENHENEPDEGLDPPTA
ncbi:SMC-Scp complex subunit ScpB [Gemmatimonadota bacterium]